MPYLDGIRARFPAQSGSFLGYPVGTANLADPPIQWRGTARPSRQPISTGTTASSTIHRASRLCEPHPNGGLSLPLAVDVSGPQQG